MIDSSVVQVFLRAHFDYDPAKDTMIPCQDAGLSFKNGDVLQIVEQDDPNWWQVRQSVVIVQPYKSHVALMWH